MRQLTAFTKKELRESLRTGRMPLLVILSVLFGIMNPLVAKLTPWMMENFAGSLEESGMVLTEIKASDRKSTRLNSSHSQQSRMPSSA